MPQPASPTERLAAQPAAPVDATAQLGDDHGGSCRPRGARGTVVRAAGKGGMTGPRLILAGDPGLSAAMTRAPGPALATPGGTAAATQIDIRRKPIRSIDEGGL